MIVENKRYKDILKLIRSTPAPITVGFNNYPPISKKDAMELMGYGYTLDDVKYVWMLLCEKDDTFVYNKDTMIATLDSMVNVAKL